MRAQCEGTGCLGPNVSGLGGAFQNGKGLGHSQHKEPSVFTKARKLTSVQGMTCCLPGTLNACHPLPCLAMLL